MDKLPEVYSGFLTAGQTVALPIPIESTRALKGFRVDTSIVLVRQLTGPFAPLPLSVSVAISYSALPPVNGSEAVVYRSGALFENNQGLLRFTSETYNQTATKSGFLFYHATVTGELGAGCELVISLVGDYVPLSEARSAQLEFLGNT